jgi:3-dehydroquinate dehydratase/shikimate dehydrogenase
MPDLLLSHPWLGVSGYRVCVSIGGGSPGQLVERAAAALEHESFLELRLDSLAEPLLAVATIGSLLAEHPDAQLVATCRRTVAGGGFTGSVEAELAVLLAAAEVGCSIVDLALESSEAMRLDQHREFRKALDAAGALLLVSYHDYQKTRDLQFTLQRLRRHQPDLIKLVSTATSLSDNLPILRLLGQQHGCPLVAIAMGEAGVSSRVLGPRAGGLFTFASSGAGSETAPGQLSASTLRDLYRVDALGAATRVYGVAGQPIAQSLSPLMQNTAFRAKGIDAVLLPLVTASADDLIRVVRELPLAGVSVTMPLKQSILPLLDHVDPLAARVGACNTIVRTAEGKLHGYNTDLAGVIEPLARRLTLKGSRVLVEGAGGAARAAVFGLLDAGAEVWIKNRTEAAAAALAAESGAQMAEPSMLSGGWFDALVHATPAGMRAPSAAQSLGDQDQEPAPMRDQVPLPASLIFDMVYRPLETPLIRRARAEGLPVITGIEMFVQQGARQFELWTGDAAPEPEMRRVVLEALGDENG